MAYGSTVARPLAFADQGIAGRKSWIYTSTHLQAVVGASDFIGEGTTLGIAAGDLFYNEVQLMASSNTSAVSFHSVTGVGSTYTSLSAGLMISSAS